MTDDKTVAEMLREVLEGMTARPWGWEDTGEGTCGYPCTPNGCHEGHPTGVAHIYATEEGPNGFVPMLEEDGAFDARDARGIVTLVNAMEEVVALVEELPSSTKLRLLADWIDLKYPNDPDPEVQNDLRKTADALDALREKLEKEVTE